jgi:hypothetical protein
MRKAPSRGLFGLLLAAQLKSDCVKVHLEASMAVALYSTPLRIFRARGRESATEGVHSRHPA